MVRETVVYLRRHLELEPWGTRSPLALVGGDPLRAARPLSCPECGARAAGGDAFCRTCGADLQRTEVASRR
jgi:hypothetical protein